MRCPVGSAVTLFLILPALMHPPVAGQESGEGWTECRSTETGFAVIRGRLLPMNGQGPYARPVAWLYGQVLEEPFSSCRVQADSLAIFEFRSLPPGDYEIGVTGFGVGRRTRVPVRIDGDSLVVVDIPQYGENRVRECLQLPACSRILTRRTSVEMNGDEGLQLAILGHRIALALAGENWDQPEPWVACVDDSVREAARNALEEVHPNVFPSSECSLETPDTTAGSGHRAQLAHRPSSRLARGIAVDRIVRDSDDLVYMNLSYYVAPLWAAGFRCEVRKVNGSWFPRSCGMTWIS